MTTEKNNKKNRVLGIVFLVLFVVLNVVRIATRFNHPAPKPMNLNADELYRLTGVPVTMDQARDDFDRKYANGDIARMREVQRALTASRAASQPVTDSH